MSTKKNDLRVDMVKSLLLDPSRQSPYQTGESWYFQTVTYHVIGRIARIYDAQTLLLEDVSWIPEGERFSQFVDEGKQREVEPVSVPVVIHLTAEVLSYPWIHDMPRTQK